MKSLKSNGPLSDPPWLGVDTEIEYPGVDTCITVTALVGNQLVGCHLFHYWKLNQSQKLEESLTEYANEAKKHGAVKAVYVMGNLDGVIGQLKSKLAYAGGIGGSEPDSCQGKIAVKLSGPVALAFTVDGKAMVLKTR